MSKKSSKAKSKAKSTNKGNTSGASNTPKSGSGGSARSRTRERRQERQKQKRQQQQIAIAAGLAVVAVVVLILVIVTNQPAEAPIADGILERYDNIPQTTTEDGYTRLGDPNAPVLVEEFSSFSCPGCEQFHDNNFDTIIEQVEAGVIQFVYLPLTTGSIPNARGAARAAICAGEQGMFYEYHDMLFDWHTRFGNQAYSQNRLESGAENLGLSVDQFNSCLGSGRPDDVISAAQSRGIGVTPTTLINGNEFPNGGNLESSILTAFQATGLPAVPLAIDDVEEEMPEEMPEEEAPPVEAEATEEAEMAEETEDTADTEAEATEEADAATEADDESDEGAAEEMTDESSEEASDEETTDEETESEEAEATEES